MSRKVLHVTSGLGVGGAETMLYRLVRCLHGNGQEHVIVTLTDNCSFDFAALGVPLHVVDLHKSNPLRGLRQLNALIARQRPGVIQAWMYHGNVAATLSAPRDIPVVWGIHHSLHDLRNEKLQTRLLIKAGAYLSRRANTRRILYVSNASRQHHGACGYVDTKSLVIPNGFDCAEFSPDAVVREQTRLRLGFTDEHLLVGSFGRFHPVKDHALLLRAFASAARELPRARLVLAGSGLDDANAALAALIRSCGIGDRVTLMGVQADMGSLYNAMDCYVLSSKSESFPNVLGEAGACAVPCITTDVGDAARIVGDAGMVVPPGNEAALRDAVLAMLRLDARKRRELGTRARDHVVQRFGLDAVASSYDRLYGELASSPHDA